MCAEHKKPKKLLKHMASIKTLSAGQRNPPRTLVFANRVSLQLLLHALRAAQRSHMRPWCWTACFAWREVLLGISPRPCSLFAAASTVKNLFVSRVQVKTVTFLAKTLEDAGFRVATLHGERSQPEREVSQNVPVMRPQGRISRCCRPSNLLWTQRGSLSC